MKLQSLPVGACIRNQSGSFLYRVAAQSHPGYAGTTLLSDQVVLIGPLDASEGANTKGILPNSTACGSNNLVESNLLQWLNSGSADWFSPSHKGDMPPEAPNIRHQARGYTDRPGYLSELPAVIQESILESSVPVHTLKGGKPEIQYVQAGIFLPSRTEMGMGDDYGIPEGTPLPLLRDIRFRQAFLTETAAAAYQGPWQPPFPMRAGSVWRYWLRSPHLHYRYLCRYIADMGGLSFAPAYYEIIGCRPMMNVSGDIPVRRTDGPDNTYFVEEEL